MFFMSKFKFYNQKDLIINLFNQGKTYKEISNCLGFYDFNSQQNIRRLIKHYLPNSSSNNIVIKNDMKLKIEELIKQNYKPKEISKILNVNSNTINSYIFKNFPDLSFKPTLYNTNYFNEINSFSKAYILGFICADGSLIESRGSIYLTITVKYEDKAVLEFIKQELNSEHKLVEIVRQSSFDKNKKIHHIRLSLQNKEIISDIMKFGITPKKSLTMNNIINNIPYIYRDAFIIGYFDGDGSVSCNNKLKQKIDTSKFYPNYTLHINIRGTKDFLTGICNHLNIDTSHIKKYDSIPRLSFTSKKDVCRFFKCYNNLKFYYNRKYNKFLEKINHKSYDKYK